MKMRWYLKIPLGALVSLVILQTTGAVGQVSLSLRANTQSAETPKKNGTIQATAHPSLPRCPEAGVRTLQPSQVTGHHKVTLSWNASTSSANPESKAVGYCLYRSQTQNAAKQSFTKPNGRCTVCEQINPVAIAATGCVDDLVEDGTTYYYVVTAINANRIISSSSSEARAQILPETERAKPASVNSYPLCRATSVSK